MKVTTEKADLLQILSHATRLIDRRTTVPVLANVKLVAHENGQLEVSSTDLQIGLVEKISAQVKKPGTTTISAQMAYEIVRKAPEDAPIHIEVCEENDKAHVQLEAGASVFRLSALPAQDFPTISKQEGEHSFSVKGADLAASLVRASFAMAQEETRYYLNGVFFHPVTDAGGKYRLNLVATDGHRLAKIRVPNLTLPASFEGVIVPRKAVLEIIKLLEDIDTHVHVSLSATSCMFKVGDDCVLSSRLIEGTFPNYGKVIPTAHPVDVDMKSSDFAKAVERVALVSSDKFGAIKLTLEAKRVLLTANSLEYGSAKDELPTDFEGEKIEIGFNARYLLEVLSFSKGDHVVMSLKDSGTAALFRNPKDPDSDFVIMPMRA